MKINIKEIPKFVINLKKRKDRLDRFRIEMDFIGWEFNIFEAFDTNSYIGCALSHKKLAEDLLKSNDDHWLILEDDAFFMPNSKEIIQKCEKRLNEIEWDFFNLGPSNHRPLQMFDDVLVDLNNLPPKDKLKHRGIYGAHGFIMSKKSAEIISNWDTDKYIQNHHRQIPIDMYFDEVLYKKLRSFSPYNPIVTQQNDLSNINGTYDRNHHLITYNWNLYVPTKIPKEMFDIDYCKKIKT